MRRPPPLSTLFPYTTLFRSFSTAFQAASHVKKPSKNTMPTIGTLSGFMTMAAKLGLVIDMPISSRARLSMAQARSEEHTSELQSLRHLVCRLLLEKKKQHNS